MRRAIALMVVAMLLGFGAAPAVAEGPTGLAPIPVQAAAPKADAGWTAGKVVAVGVGAVAGIVVANATLPMGWGMVTPIVGAVVGPSLP